MSGLAIAAYWQATFRGHLTEDEVRVFIEQLRSTELADAKAVVDDIAATGGYPPTAQRIAELAALRKRDRYLAEERLALEPRAHAVLGEPGGHGPYMTFSFWLKNVATEDEKATVRRVAPTLAKLLREEVIE